MRLATWIDAAGPWLGVVVGEPGAERVLDVRELGDGLPVSMDALLRGDVDAALRALSAAVSAARADEGLPVATIRLAAPVPRPGKIVAIGRNYREHAEEEGAAIAADPVVFAKFPSAVTGHRSAITWRGAITSQVDYEAELAVVIARPARDVAVADALGVVLGYTCLNDVSARDLQVRDGQWVRGKSLDSFGPMGPWLVTADELPDPQRLGIRCSVNGEVRQDASTAEMIHGVASLISFCSRSFTLEPGDVIATGTPGGVGAFRVPPTFLRDGDRVTVEIEGIGALENECRLIDDG